MPAQRQPLLSVRGLRVRIGDIEIVKGVDLDVAPGEMLALVGESGCGKSITAFSLLQLLPQGARIQADRLRLDRRDLLQLGAKAMRDIRGNDISLILQEPMSSLNPVLTIGFQVDEVLRRHTLLSARQRKTDILHLFDLVGLPEPQRRYDDYPHMLSGGMRQRVMIAIAIACRPQLLIADEPTTALDVTTQAQVMDLIDGIRREMNMAVILITHDLDVVRDWAETVAVMYAGRVVEAGPVDRILAHPLHPYTRGLLRSSIRDDQHYTGSRLEEIPGSVADALNRPGCSFHPRCPIGTTDCLIVPPPAVEIGGTGVVACYKASQP